MYTLEGSIASCAAILKTPYTQGHIPNPQHVLNCPRHSILPVTLKSRGEGRTGFYRAPIYQTPYQLFFPYKTSTRVTYHIHFSDRRQETQTVTGRVNIRNKVNLLIQATLPIILGYGSPPECHVTFYIEMPFRMWALNYALTRMDDLKKQRQSVSHVQLLLQLPKHRWGRELWELVRVSWWWSMQSGGRRIRSSRPPLTTQKIQSQAGWYLTLSWEKKTPLAHLCNPSIWEAGD